MELSGLLTFASIFVAILVILAGIAYHFMREQDDVVPVSDATASGSTSTGNSKKSKKNQQQHRDSSSAKAKQPKPAPKAEKKSNNSDKSEPEDEPFVIIPDPFTKQINSRYASVMGANANNNQQAAKKESNERKNASVANGFAQKLKDEQQSSQASSNQVNYKNSDFITVNSASVGANQASAAASASATANFVSNNKINFDKANADAAKVRPKATVKPSQAIKESSSYVNGSVSKPASLIPQPNPLAKPVAEKDLTRLVKSVSSTLGSGAKAPISEQVLQAANVMIAPTSETDKLKIQQLNEALNEKSKQIEALNQANASFKSEIAKFNARVSDFESLKSTNQVIQRELTNWTQKYISLEKEKKLAEEKLRTEIANLERAKQVESVKQPAENNTENIQKYEARINYLQTELSELQKRFKDSDESHLKKIQELSSRVLTSDSLVKDSQIENQKLNAKLAELVEKNKELAETLQSNEDYIKKIDSQLSSSVSLINELKSNENQLDNRNKMLQVKQETELSNLKETLEVKTREIEALKQENKSLTSKVEEFKTVKPSEQNGHSEPKDNKQDEEIKQKNAEIVTLKAKVDETTKKNESLQSANKTLNDQIGICESKIAELEKKIDIFKQVTEKLKNAQPEPAKPDTASKEELAKKTAELEKEKEKVKKLESELEAERKKLNELKQKGPIVLKEVPADIEKKLQSLAEDNQKLKVKNFNLKSIWEATEQSMVNLEKSIEQNEKRLNDEINSQKAAVNKLQEEKRQLEKELENAAGKATNGVSKTTTASHANNDKSKKVNGNHEGLNGHQNGNGHVSDDEEVVQLKQKLETYKQENDALKQIIEEESRSGKLSDRSQIRKILKFGQEKLEKEMIIVEKLQEKFDKH